MSNEAYFAVFSPPQTGVNMKLHKVLLTRLLSRVTCWVRVRGGGAGGVIGTHSLPWQCMQSSVCDDTSQFCIAQS